MRCSLPRYRALARVVCWVLVWVRLQMLETEAPQNLSATFVVPPSES